MPHEQTIHDAVVKVCYKIGHYFSLKGRDSVTGAIMPLWLHHYVIGGMALVFIGVLIDAIKNI